MSEFNRTTDATILDTGNAPIDTYPNLTWTYVGFQSADIDIETRVKLMESKIDKMEKRLAVIERTLLRIADKLNT